MACVSKGQKRGKHLWVLFVRGPARLGCAGTRNFAPAPLRSRPAVSRSRSRHQATHAQGLVLHSWRAPSQPCLCWLHTQGSQSWNPSTQGFGRISVGCTPGGSVMRRPLSYAQATVICAGHCHAQATVICAGHARHCGLSDASAAGLTWGNRPGAVSSSRQWCTNSGAKRGNMARAICGWGRA